MTELRPHIRIVRDPCRGEERVRAVKPRRRNLPKLRPVECPACHKVPKCMRHPCLTSKRYYIVECRPYCGRAAGGYTQKQAIDEWSRRIGYELRL